MKRHIAMRVLLPSLLALSTLAGGCDLFKSRQNDQVFWALQTGDVNTAQQPPSAAAARVRSIGAQSPISSAPLVYRYPNGQVRADSYNSWISPIGVLATSELQGVLRKSGRFQGVLGPTDPGEVWTEVQVSFIDASAHFEDGKDKAFARVSVVSTWMGGEDEDQVLRQAVFTHDVPLKGDSAQAVVEAISAAWTQAVADVLAGAPVKP